MTIPIKQIVRLISNLEDLSTNAVINQNQVLLL